jgi:hypothetical protein
MFSPIIRPLGPSIQYRRHARLPHRGCVADFVGRRDPGADAEKPVVTLGHGQEAGIAAQNIFRVRVDRWQESGDHRIGLLARDELASRS